MRSSESPALPPIRELLRFPAPGPEPLGLAVDGSRLWISSREAHRLFAVAPATGRVIDECATPGAPFGIAVAADAFRVVIGFGDDDDDRYIYRFVPRRGFENVRIACPDLSGVHVAFDGGTLYLSQAHNKKILALDDEGEILREVKLDRRPVGMTISDDTFYLVTVDDDWKNPQLTAIDAGGETLRLRSLASMPFRGRGLAFDGQRFWTGNREVNEIVAFTAPVPT